MFHQQNTCYNTSQQQQQQQTMLRRNLTQTQSRMQQPSYRQSQQQQQKQQQQQQERQKLSLGIRQEESLTYAPALTKLKLEADKIRKWKTATQFELKRKESQIYEMREQLKVQYNLVTSVRVREESLKTKLQDQITSHTEIKQKMLVTRGLCSVLKEKVEQTEAALGQAHADQDDNRDLDNQRIEQYRILTGKFKSLEDKQNKVQSALEEALIKEGERINCLEEELTNERARNSHVTKEKVELQDQLITLHKENEEVKVRVLEGEEKVENGIKMRVKIETEYHRLGDQLQCSHDDNNKHLHIIASLNNEILRLETSLSSVTASLEEQFRANNEQCQSLEVQLKEMTEAYDRQQTELVMITTEKDNMDIALSSLREELCSVEVNRRDDIVRLTKEIKTKAIMYSQQMASLTSDLTTANETLTSDLTTANETLTSLQTKLSEVEACLKLKTETIRDMKCLLEETEARNINLESEVKEHVCMIEEMKGKRIDEWQREKIDLQTTISTLNDEIKTLETKLDDNDNTHSHTAQQLENDRSVVMTELCDVKQQLETVVSDTKSREISLEKTLVDVRSEYEEVVQKYQMEIEKYKDTQLREKESFDTQVTELCGMLERYRNENHKIVQQKDLQIKNIQNSLTDTSKTKETAEEMLKNVQDHVNELSEEVIRLQSQVEDKECLVREKDKEMADLLKAIDVLRNKQQQLSHTHHHPSPHHSPPHTPHIPMVSSIAPPMTAPVYNTLSSLRQRQRSSEDKGRQFVTATTPTRPALKKLRCDHNDDDMGVVIHDVTTDSCEDIIFRKPRPLIKHNRPSRVPVPLKSRYNMATSSTEEVSSTANITTKMNKPRVRGGRGRKSTGGTKKDKQGSGTAWFDVDAVFGFGPED